MKQRIDYLDIAKGIGTLLMVSAHIYDSELYQVMVYSFHMPLFLLISGFLLGRSRSLNGSFFQFLSSRFKGLMVPYIITELCVLPLFYLKYGYQPSDLRWIITDSLFLYYTRGAATWFLLSLFLAEIIFWFLRKYLRNRNILLVVCSVLYILAAQEYQGNHIVIIILRSLVGMFFLAVGYSVSRMEKKISLSRKQLILLSMIFVIAALYNGQVSMVDSDYGNLVLYTYTSLVGSYLILLGSKWFSNGRKLGKYNNFIRYWGRNSLYVVCTHLIFLRYGIDWYFDCGPRYPFFASSLIFVLVLLCEFAVIEIICRCKTTLCRIRENNEF